MSSSVLTCTQHVVPSLEGSVSSIADQLASGVCPETLHITASVGIKSLLIPVANLQILGNDPVTTWRHFIPINWSLQPASESWLGNALSESLLVIWGRTEMVLEEVSQAKGWAVWREKEQRAKRYSEHSIGTQPAIAG